MALTFSVFNKFKAVDGVTAPVRRMEKSVGRFGRTTTKQFKKADRASSKLAGRLKSLAAIGISLVGITAITHGLAGAITTGAEFEQTIVNAAAKFGGAAQIGSANFKALEDAAAKAGKTTEFSAVQAAEGLNYLAMAGFDVNQSISALPGVIDLATASSLELGRASDIATDTLGAFNLATKDATQLQKNLTRVSDVMAKTATTANTDMEQLFETFQTAAPVATSLGASIETVSAMAGVLANSGIKASVAGTTLKNVFTRLAAATPKAQKQLDKLHISLKDGSGNFRDVFDILEDLNKSMSSLGEVERAAVLNDIFGKIPIAGVNVLMSKGAEGLRKYRTQLENSTGAAQKMAEMMRKTLGNRFKIFKSTLEGFKITLFKTLYEQLGRATVGFTGLIKVTDDWLKQNKESVQAVLTNVFAGFYALYKVVSTLAGWMVTFMKANANLAPVLKTIIALLAAYKTITIAAAAATKIFNVLMAMNPLGLFVIAATAVVLAINAIRENWQYLVDDFKRFIAGTLNLVIAGLSKFVRMAATVGRFLGFDTAGLTAAADELGELRAVVKGGKIVPVSPNAGVARTLREERKNTANVNVDFSNLPAGTKVDKGKDVPGFSLNTGFAGATP